MTMLELQLLRLFSLSHLKAHGLRAVLTIVGVALGAPESSPRPAWPWGAAMVVRPQRTSFPRTGRHGNEMRHAELRLPVHPPTGGRNHRVPPHRGGGTRRLRVNPVRHVAPAAGGPAERQLMTAVLVDAIAALRKYRHPGDSLARIDACVSAPRTRRVGMTKTA